MNNTVNNFIQNAAMYLKGVKTEWTKITWPEKNQVIVETFFVILIVLSFTVAIYLIDVIFAKLLGFIPTR